MKQTKENKTQRWEPPTPGVLPQIVENTKPATLPTNEEIEKALIKTTGLISYASQELNCPVETLKKLIIKSKQLRGLLDELRNVMIDAAENTLLYRVVDKRDLIASMFLLKTIGKKRGWVEKEDKAGSSADKPVFIKILPVDSNGNTEGKKGRGRPKKIYAEAKILPPSSLALNEQFNEKEKELVGNVKDFIDAEIIE